MQTVTLHSVPRIGEEEAAGNILTFMLLHVISGIGDSWYIRGYVYMFCTLMSLLRAYVRGPSDAENLSVCLVSDGEILCLLNPMTKQMLKCLSRRHSLMCLLKASSFVVSTFGILSSGFSIKTALDIGDVFPTLLFLSWLDLFRHK